MSLNPKQQRFVAEYLVDLNATQAAIRAGYSAKWAEKNATRLTGNDGIVAAIAEGTKKQLAKVELTADMVKDRLRMLAFQDIRKLFDAQGNLKPLHELDDDAAAMVAGLEVVKKNVAAGDGVVDTVHKVKVVDPVKALEMLAKHYGLLAEKVEHTGGVEVVFRWQK
jgi:phage terminase small subunit